MKKRIRINVLILLLMFSFFSCQRNKSVLKTANMTADYAVQGYVKGLVEEVTLDGCTWVISLQDSADKRIEPDVWLPGYQIQGLQVWIKYEVQNRLSICMIGQTVHIVGMKKR